MSRNNKLVKNIFSNLEKFEDGRVNTITSGDSKTTKSSSYSKRSSIVLSSTHKKSLSRNNHTKGKSITNAR